MGSGFGVDETKEEWRWKTFRNETEPTQEIFVKHWKRGRISAIHCTGIAMDPGEGSLKKNSLYLH